MTRAASLILALGAAGPALADPVPLRDLVQCWNHAGGVAVTVGFTLDDAGRPLADTIRLRAPRARSEAVTEAFTAARRAILRCGQDGYILPEGRDVEIRFAPPQVQS